MKTEYKELLLRDLCARLPYRVKVSTYRFGDSKRTEVVETLYAIYKYDWSMETEEDDFARPIGKPYLFPLSSMTEEQDVYMYFNTKFRIDFTGTITPKVDEEGEHIYVELDDWMILYDWFNKNHFDYRGLIKRGLAIDATNLGIYK